MTLDIPPFAQVLDIHSVTRMVNELRTTVPQPPGVTFKVLRESDRQPLLVNNDDEIELSPSISREEFTVLDISTKKGTERGGQITRKKS